jgi:hypothetical protein
MTLEVSENVPSREVVLAGVGWHGRATSFDETLGPEARPGDADGGVVSGLPGGAAADPRPLVSDDTRNSHGIRTWYS